MTAAAPITLEQALLLCTRLCHDLAGPIGALGTGAELLQEDGPGAPLDGETLTLLADSAHAASARLQILRMAAGTARSHQPALADALGALDTVLALGGRRLVRRVEPAYVPDGPRVRLLVALVLVAADAWPHAPTLSVEATPTTLALEADGAPPLSPAWSNALADPPQDLDPRTILAWLARHLADAAGMTLDTTQPGRLVVSAPPS
ncbi:histidine phosphotransferase family protein [Pararhodospirillum oryzae]|uniref:Histidine phosphotransferase ChpT C-terminal domain-containing protein n=1 Tax=Pararhodospirillum oryzae TaxID=478448 RepID=A0A512H4B0_9PROT|nr:histidine phosphotransferase family protein [Pararhodospirillum oryzae]GEO80220.1 hypothetical protein ROR02_03510 [Pararhodospirillum oryzae]